MIRIDYRLNALVDAGLSAIGSLPALAALAARNGTTLVQYRDKTASTRMMIERARAISAALEGTGVPLVVNDRVDVALAAGAAGVHLGAEDMDAETARLLLGPKAIIGLTLDIAIARMQGKPHVDDEALAMTAHYKAIFTGVRAEAGFQEPLFPGIAEMMARAPQPA